MNAGQQQAARQIAELLGSDDEIWLFAAGAIADSRDQAPRTADDRDSGDVLNDLITALRNA